MTTLRLQSIKKKNYKQTYKIKGVEIMKSKTLFTQLFASIFLVLFSATSLIARPILDQSFEPELTTIGEDAAAISGNSIDSIVVEGSIEDFEGSTNSIAVTGVDNSHGVWQYSLDNGDSWQAFTMQTGTNSAFADQAVLLSGIAAFASTNKIRFISDAGYPDENADMADING